MKKIFKIALEFQKTRNLKTKKAHCGIFVTSKSEFDYFMKGLDKVYKNSLIQEEYTITRDKIIFKDSGDTIEVNIVKNDADYEKFHGLEYCMIASLSTLYWDLDKYKGGHMENFNNHVWSCLRDHEEDNIELKFLEFNNYSDNVKVSKFI